MKAVIVDIKGRSAAALSDDGCIIKVKNNNYAIGQVIKMNKQIIHKPMKLVASIACLATFLMSFGVGAYAYFTPYSYVSLDINPSIEYSINRFDRVLSVEAVNDDGENILEEIELGDLTNKKIDEAIALTVGVISKDGYFDADTEDADTEDVDIEDVDIEDVDIEDVDIEDVDTEDEGTHGGIVISTSADDLQKAEELADKLEQTIKEETQKNGDAVEVEVVSVGKERVERARKLGVTPGKLNLVEKLQASATGIASIDIKEWLDKPVKEIMKATKQYKKMHKLQAETPTDIAIEDDTPEETNNEETEDIAPTVESEVSEKETLETKKKEEKQQEKAGRKEEKQQEKTARKEEKHQEKVARKEEKQQEKAVRKEEKQREKTVRKEDKQQEKTVHKEEKQQEKAARKEEKQQKKASNKED